MAFGKKKGENIKTRPLLNKLHPKPDKPEQKRFSLRRAQPSRVQSSTFQVEIRITSLVGEEGPRIPGVKDSRVCFLKILSALLAFFISLNRVRMTFARHSTLCNSLAFHSNP